MIQDYEQQADASFFPKLYALGVIKVLMAKDGDISDEFAARVPEHISDLVEQFNRSFMIGVSADNWGDEWGENQMSYLARLGIESLIVLEAVADPSVDRLDSLVSDVGSVVTTTKYDPKRIEFVMNFMTKSDGVTPLSRERFLEEQVATQYGEFIEGLYNRKDQLKKGLSTYYANFFLHTGIQDFHWDTAIQLGRWGPIVIEMESENYNITGLEYVDKVRYEMQALLKAKQYLLNRANTGGLSSVTDQTIKEAMHHAYDETRDDFLHRERLISRIEDAAIFIMLEKGPISQEELRRLQKMGKVLEIKDEFITSQADAFFED